MYRRSQIGQYNQYQRGTSALGLPGVAGRSPLQQPRVSNIRGNIERPSVIGTSPIGRGVVAQQPIIRPSGIPLSGGLQQPLVSGVPRGSIVSPSPVFGVSPPALRRSFVGRPIGNLPINQSPIGRGIAGNSPFAGAPVTVAGQSISVVPTPSVIEATQSLPVIQPGANMGNYYEVTKPTV